MTYSPTPQKQEEAAMRLSRAVTGITGTLAALGAAAAAAPVAPGPSPIPKAAITISKETTYFLGPLKADGTVDHPAALNSVYSEGVTAENNAAVPLLQAFGPRLLSGRPDQQKVRQRIGAPSLGSGPYFIDRDEYVRGLPTRGPDGAATKRPSGTDLLLDVEKRFPWTEREHPLAAGWLKANEGALARIVEGARRPRFWLPLREGVPLWDRKCPSTAYRDAAVALCGRAMLELGSNDVARAWEDLQTSHRLGALVAREPSVMEFLLGAGMEPLFDDALAGLATRGAVTPEQARRILADLDTLPSYPSGLDVIDRLERVETLALAIGLAVEGGGSQGWELLEAPPSVASAVGWDDVLRTINRWFDRFGMAARQDGSSTAREAIRKWLSEAHAAEAKAKATLDAVGRQPAGGGRRTAASPADLSEAMAVKIISGVGTGFDTMARIANRDYQDAYARLDRLGLALAAHRGEKGAFPAALSGLVPQYAQEVPVDPLTSQPFVYEKRGNGYLLYSLGPDGKPDRAVGGKTGDDIVLRVE
jgi:hypothetical protein